MQLFYDGTEKALQLILSGDEDVLAAAWRSLWISTLAVSFAAINGIPFGIFIARRKFFGNRLLTHACRTGMALPTVFVGLICFSLFARKGPMGSLELLYTPWAILAGEFLLAFPIIAALTQGSVLALDPKLGETVKTLGASPFRRFLTYTSEAHIGIKLAILTAFSRCVTELGIALMVGGNLKGETRTLSTATALETSKGELGTAMAMGIILLILALSVTVLTNFLSREEPK
ncbi:MAG: ABC transporter permease [Planctomycetota bacterium]|nr:ABC transporter permease [Planctomycetota bacterium]